VFLKAIFDYILEMIEHSIGIYLWWNINRN